MHYKSFTIKCIDPNLAVEITETVQHCLRNSDFKQASAIMDTGFNNRFQSRSREDRILGQLENAGGASSLPEDNRQQYLEPLISHLPFRDKE